MSPEQQIPELIKLANRSKTIGRGMNYSLANRIFATLLYAHFKLGGSSPMELILETADPDGEEWDEAYYDLFVLECEGEALCMPAPKLDPRAILAAMKQPGMTVAERGEHGRRYEKPAEGEPELLEERLNQLLWPGAGAVVIVSGHDAEDALSFLRDENIGF